jgi:hypothetical protein
VPPFEVLPPWYGHIYIIISNPPLNTKRYEATIKNFPNFIYVDFIHMMAGSLGGWGKWVHYKHLYFILQCVAAKQNISFISQHGVGMKCTLNESC